MTATPTGVSSHWLFSGLSPGDLAPVVSQAKEVRFLPGQVVFREGEAADGLYVVVAGQIRVAAENKNGETQIAVAGRNGIVGEMGVLDGQPRSGTATSVGVSAAYFVPAAPFLEVLARSTLLGMRLLAVLARKMRDTNSTLADLAGLGGDEAPTEIHAPSRQSPGAHALRPRTEVDEYLTTALPMMERLDEEYRSWMRNASEDARTLSLSRDSDGQHAAVYLWRVTKDTRDFTLMPVPKAVRRFHEAYVLCLEAREKAAQVYKEAAEVAPVRNPTAGIAEANRRILEAERQWTRAWTARQEMEGGLSATR
ncbi:MAG TPA: cyclic nucleotide-binding domain-containing protein [Chloroflexota bacterium]|nr:cyclic nucleotide-binding domain-containing protein [Chloroflexota bacterium]